MFNTNWNLNIQFQPPLETNSSLLNITAGLAFATLIILVWFIIFGSNGKEPTHWLSKN
jgi:hypothetical protein